jgi:type IV pilus assembly protein PilB
VAEFGDKSKLGQMLVGNKLITPELKMALEYQKSLGGKLGAIMVKLGLIEDDVLTNFIAKQYGLPVAEVDKLVLPENLVKKVPRSLVEQHHVLPIGFKDDTLTIVTSDPDDFDAIEQIQLSTNHRVDIALASRASIAKAINELYYGDKSSGKSKEEMIKDLEESDLSKDIEEISATSEVTPTELRRALVPLLIAKGVITEEELIKKAKELRSM